MNRLRVTKTPVPAAELVGVVKRFGPVTALDGVDLALERGKVTALLGPNGAGKTTAVKMMLGLARPTEGRVELFGGDPLAAESRMRVGAMMQISSVPETLKVREHIDLFRSYYPSPLPVDQILAMAGLEEIGDRLYGKLSGGQKQRVMFALAACGDPDMLFLDEPTVGLDVEARRAFWNQIRGGVERGRTVLLTTHYLEEADALADRIVVIDQGRIVADGSPQEIKTRAASRRIRCRTALPADEIQALEGVVEVRPSGEYVEVLTAVAEPVVRQLLARDPFLSGLEIVGADLEQAFLALTSPGRETAEKGAA